MQEPDGWLETGERRRSGKEGFCLRSASKLMRIYRAEQTHHKPSQGPTSAWTPPA